MIVSRESGRARVQPAWQGRTVVCIASGPSLTESQLRAIEAARAADALRVIAINDQYLVAPWADACYFADARWWKRHEAGFERRWDWARFSAKEVAAARAAFRGQWISITNGDEIKRDDVYVLKNAGGDGLSLDPGGICTGSNSGYQAINVAVLAGAKRVLLVGYDMQYAGERTHSHDGHEHRQHVSVYHEFAVRFGTMAPALEQLGVAVLNCTPRSRITAFPHADLVEALACAPGA